MSLASFNESIFSDYLAGQKALLPNLPDIQKVTPRVTRVLGANPGQFQLQGTNTYIVGSGRERILVDTAQGEPEWIKFISSALEAGGYRISHVLLTHWHWDHTGGVPDLITLYPELSSAIYKNHPDNGQLPIEDGQVFKVEGATVRAVHTPGHAYDHMCFVLEEENALFTGDNVLGHGYTVVEDLGLFTTSLDVMENQKCKIGYPAHGDVIADLPTTIAQYKGQQVRRERQIIMALKRSREQQKQEGSRHKGSATVREIVMAVYGDVTEEVSKLALEPYTNEVLMKLAQDQKVGFQFQRGSKRWFLSALA
ncbi:beta-lactamase-like protein [Aspergillus alliaceus]|uniref:Beta-lactamase-like protein n=1 Tax=Petromyces alliaceus TaxID=209559 RepID=A0A5N6G4B6_PETAA|nr:beta-lactamase-like protein [Aspergillus alliaceus]KAB8237122.1 beta-lactamase-like protein [Aspergillus alliaceus]KAE8389673.1 beta-lactamase-like protein [Aspergillus alliaceus]